MGKKSNHTTTLFISIMAIIAVSSCATVFNGTKAKILLTNDNVTEPVNITADNKQYNNVTLPYRVKVKRGYKNSEVKITSNGYEPFTMSIDKVFNGTYIANILFPPGFIIDAATGAIMKPEQKTYFVNLVRKNDIGNYVIYNNVLPQNYVEIPETDEKNVDDIIIRWAIDSEPRGARIFWRVVSNIPEIVKNTNELYLGTTPYEDTRSFNILGLTYENAKNVQIEIKMTKNGYIDQIKRFNVRQALEQQEISTFFELVAK